MTRERRLGRGLEALLGRRPNTPTPAEPPSVEAPVDLDLDPTASDAPNDEAPSIKPPAMEPPLVTQPPLMEPPTIGAVYGEATEATYAMEPPPAAESLHRLDAGEPTASVPPPHRPGLTEDRPPGPAETRAADGPRHIDVRQIDANPFQPRQDFDSGDTDTLAESVSAHGLLQPLVVRRVGDRYQLVAGERRLRAVKQAGWSEVSAQVVEADDREATELALVENLLRKDLNPLEKAASFQRYLEKFGCTQEELATRIQRDRSTVANLIRLLELPQAVQDAVRSGEVSQGHARALLPLGEEDEQVEFCQRIRREGLSVRATEALVQETIAQAESAELGMAGGTPGGRPAQSKSEHLLALEQEFRLALGTKTKITHNTRGRGKIVVHFHTHDEFERLRRLFCGESGSELHHRAG